MCVLHSFCLHTVYFSQRWMRLKLEKIFVRTICSRVWCTKYMCIIYEYLTGCAIHEVTVISQSGKCVFSIISYVIELLPNVCVVCCKRQRENLSARALHYENFSLFLLQTFFPSIAFHTCLWNIADDTNIEKLKTFRISNGLSIECCWYTSCSFISTFLESEYCHFFTIRFLFIYAEKGHKKTHTPTIINDTDLEMTGI